MFLRVHHISQDYVMSVFNLHSSVLNFHCEGSVTDVFNLLPCDCKIYHSELLILLMSGTEEKPTWQDMELTYGITASLPLPAPLLHSFYLLCLCPSLFYNF